jgi:PKD repeat protein
MNTTPSKALLVLSASLTLLTACGGGGSAQDPPVAAPPPPPVVNQPPVASFTAPTTAVAGTAVALDASSSTDPENGPLTHHWDFGDNHSGGNARQAHWYAQPGSYTVRLTVTDAQGLRSTVSRSISVTAGPAAERSVQARGLITDTAGQPLAGVQVAVQGTSAVATSDAQGRVALTVGVGVDVTLRLNRAGHAEQVKVLKLPSVVGQDAYFEASLLPRAAAQTLADAAAGGSLAGVDGAGITLPANALVDEQGNPVTGPVQVTMTPVDINSGAVAAFPGRFEGMDASGSASPIASYGTTEYTLTQGGRALQLKPGARAILQLPLYVSAHLSRSDVAAGDTIPLWSLHEPSGRWVLEGAGTVVPSAASPTGWAMRAEVGHFSWWNADMPFTPFRPKPRCINDVPGQYDDIFAQAMICKMLAEMDRPIPAQGAAANPGRAQALAAQPANAAPAPRFPFPAVRIEDAVPMAGGVAMDVPPDHDVALIGTALNGTWRGRAVVRGGQGATADPVVPLRPVLSGGTSELIALPFDSVRAAEASFRVDTYRFVVQAGQEVAIVVSASASTLTGRIRLRNAAGELLDGASFSTQESRLQVRLPSAGEYRVEVEPGTGAPGAYRLRASVVAGPPTPPAPVGTEGPDLRSPLVVADRGSLMTLWFAPDAANNPQLMAMRSTAANQAWTSPQRLVPALGFNALAFPPPHAVADRTGMAWVLWFDATNKMPMLTRGALGADSAWSEPLALGSTACRGTGVQRLAVNALGQAVAMWQRAAASAGANAGWCLRRFVAGAWQPEEVLSPAPGHNFASTALHLVLTDGGQAVAAWHRGGISALVVAQQDAAGQPWSDPLELDATANDPLTAGASWNALAAASDGTLVLTWRSKGASALNDGLVFAAVKRPGQAWSAPIELGKAPSTGFGFPQVGWLGGARFAAAWNDPVAGPRVREYQGSSGWGATQALASNAAAPSNTVLWNLAAANDGSAIVVSQGLLPGVEGWHLFLDVRDPVNGAWRTTPPTPAAALVPGGYGPPVAVDAGWAGLTWLQTFAGGYQVRAMRLPMTP